MNQEKKTSSFLEAINKYAQEQSEAILKEAEIFKQEEIEKATKEAINDAYTLIQKNISVEKSKIVSEYAKKEQDSRKELFNRRSKIVEKVFEKAKQKLIEYTSTDNYDSYIRKSAQEIANLFNNNECVIYIKSTDECKIELIKSIIPNCVIERDISITIGGIKGYCESLSIVADNTLDTKLSDQREWFAQNSNLKVV